MKPNQGYLSLQRTNRMLLLISALLIAGVLIHVLSTPKANWVAPAFMLFFVLLPAGVAQPFLFALSNDTLSRKWAALLGHLVVLAYVGYFLREFITKTT